jgi:hypothetical protein
VFINPLGGLWGTPANWLGGVLPGPRDDAVLGVLGPVIHDGGADTVRSLRLTAGTLAVTSGSALATTDGLTLAAHATLLADSGGVFTGGGDPQAGAVDGANLVALGGGALYLPAASSCANLGVGATTLQADGDGSVLALPNVAGLENGLINLDVLTVRASAGGFVDLPGATTIADGPGGGLFFLNHIDVVADGPGSVVNLPALARFSGNPRGVGAHSSSLQATGGGTLNLNPLTTTVGSLADVVLSAGGTIQVGALWLQGDATLSGSGTVSGGVINNGQVLPGDAALGGALVIGGNYTQASTGLLTLRLGPCYGQLVVNNLATLAGTVDVRVADGFQPAPGDQFQVLLFGQGEGTFSRRTGDSDRFDFVYVYDPPDSFAPGLTLVAY